MGALNNPMNQFWYAVQTFSGAEKRSRDIIHENFPNIKTLLPMRVLDIRKKGNTKRLIKPFFTGYFFIQTTHELNIIEAKEIVTSARNIGLQTGIIRIVGTYIDKTSRGSDVIPPIADSEMEYILMLTQEQETVEFSDYVKDGDKVTIVAGPLKGLEGVIKRVNPRKKRISIMLKLLGEERNIDLGGELVQRIEPL